MFKSIKWKQTSLLCIILAPLLLITTPMCYYNHGQGVEILAVMWLMFFTGQLACWFGGIFRAFTGAFCIVLSLAGFGLCLFQMMSGELQRVSGSIGEALLALIIWVLLSCLPLALREQYFYRASKPSSDDALANWS